MTVLTTSAVRAPEPRPASREALPAVPAPTFVLLGGVPGAGKTTVLNRLRRDRADRCTSLGTGLGTVDAERLARRIGRLLPAAVPYRWYRPVVHSLNTLHVLLRILRGPVPTGPALVVHDPATRPRRRHLTGRLARLRGWTPVLVLLDVDREVALAGQHRRGRVMAAGSFDRHWQRWSEQRSRLRAVSAAGNPDAPWARVLVVRRDSALAALTDVLG